MAGLQVVEQAPVPPTPTPEPTVEPCALDSDDSCETWGTPTPPPVTPTTPYTIHVEIPPNSRPTTAWLMMREEEGVTLTPKINATPADFLLKTDHSPGGSIWSVPIPPELSEESGSITVTTDHPEQLNAILLFAGDSPFHTGAVMQTTADLKYTQEYTFDVPQTSLGKLNVLYPLLDVTNGANETVITVSFNGQSLTKKFTIPNMNNGLNFTGFPFDLNDLGDEAVQNLPVTISVETEDPFVWSLGPRVCRPVYVKNTAYLCSDQAGCFSATDQNIPPGFPAIFLPLILKN